MKKIDWKDTKGIDLIAQKLQSGQLIAGTTDTVVGLFAPLTRSGFEKLNTTKGRFDKPYLVLVPDIQKAIRFSKDFEKPHVKKIIESYWPGPLTVIVNAHESLPAHVTSGQGTIAIRVPSHKGIQNLLRYFDGLFSTSANLAGGPVPASIDQIDQAILEHIEILVSDDLTQTVPSTIIDVTEAEVKVIRQGAIKV